jgi:hypothetical protein
VEEKRYYFIWIKHDVQVQLNDERSKDTYRMRACTRSARCHVHIRTWQDVSTCRAFAALPIEPSKKRYVGQGSFISQDSTGRKARVHVS